MEFATGHVIADRYKVLELLGAGGMGAVYLVEDVSSKQRYALKTILASGVSDRNLQRFEMETKATRLLEHPNLVRIHDFGFINEFQPYFVMDFFEGKDLSEMIKDEGPFPVEKAIEVFTTICNALTYAHTQGVVHRDLKPSNVMIANGQVKILDFGIAKVLREGTEYNTLTQTGEIFGSPYYMSPEQCLGKPVDLRSDVYSLGCMFFEALTGTPPFVGETAVATMLKHQAQEPLSLKAATLGGNFSSDLELVVAQMLAKNVANRYSDLLQVAEDLRHVQRGEPISPLKVVEGKQPPNWRVLIGIGCAAVLCVWLVNSNLHPPAQRTSYSSVFSHTDTTPKIPRVESMRDKFSAPTGYYSVLNPKNNKVRDFHFPWRSFGDFGYGENRRSYLPARGLRKNVQIPMSLHIKQDCAAISGFRNDEVDNLILRGYMVNDQTTEVLKDWSKVTSLNMNDTDISDASIDNFTGMKDLTILGVNDTNITGDGLLKLPLEQLYSLECNHIKNAKVLLPRLRSGNFIANLSLIGDGIRDEDLKLIGQFQKLNTLSLLENHITDKGIEYLSNAPKLKNLYVEGKEITPNILGSLKKMKMHRVVIQNCPWSIAQQDEFRHKLKRENKALKLDLLVDTQYTGPRGSRY